MRERWQRWITILACSAMLLLGACSGTTFVYNRLDFLLPWYVDDYASLDGEQEMYLSQLLEPFLAWHRNQELPAYVQIIDEIEGALDREVTAQGIEAIFKQMQDAWLRLEAEALDWLLDLGAQLSDEQIAGFLDVVEEQQAELEEEYLTRTDEEFHEESYENLVDNAREYLGALSDEQRKLLRDSSRRLLRSDKAWLNERAQWLQELSVLLERKPQWQQRLREAVARRRENPSPEYQRIFNHNMSVVYELIAQLLNSRTPAQDEFLRGKLRELRQDLRTLIEQGKPQDDRQLGPGCAADCARELD